MVRRSLATSRPSNWRLPQFKVSFSTGRCPTNRNERKKQALRRRQTAQRVEQGLPRAEEDVETQSVADALEVEAAQRNAAKVILYFARLLKHPDPPSATWEELEAQPAEAWIPALGLPIGSSTDRIEGERIRVADLVERGLLD